MFPYVSCRSDLFWFQSSSRVHVKRGSHRCSDAWITQQVKRGSAEESELIVLQKSIKIDQRTLGPSITSWVWSTWHFALILRVSCKKNCMYELNIVHLDHCNTDDDGTGHMYVYMAMNDSDSWRQVNAEFNLTFIFTWLIWRRTFIAGERCEDTTENNMISGTERTMEKWKIRLNCSWKFIFMPQDSSKCFKTSASELSRH